MSNDIFSVQGDLIFLTVPGLKKEGADFIQSCDSPTFDFARVQKTDSSAIALLLAWRRIAKSTEKAIRFENLPQQLVEVAETYGVKDLL